MLIEEEAEAVFNEIRNRRRVLVEDKKSVSREPSPGKKSVSPTPMITINVNVLSSPERSVPEIEEPVSPPSCHPDEGPPLLFSQSIEVSKKGRLSQLLYIMTSSLPGSSRCDRQGEQREGGRGEEARGGW